MSDPTELRRRLRRLGRPQRRSPHVRTGSSQAERGLPPGDEIDTAQGGAYRIENRYPLDHAHGSSRLSDLLAFETTLAAEIAPGSRLEDTSLERLAFLDTETTGLGGGAGTLAFLVGIGVFTEDGFRLRQYFLRDPSEEAGMLSALQEDLEGAGGFVTFNGRVFDLPLLETRYLLSLRQRHPLRSVPHLDLLHPARRLWRMGLRDCSLGTLEQEILQVTRTEQDVPGSQIPEMYLAYLRTGDATEMARVVYHNLIDILSLVGLATQILQRHQAEDPAELSQAEALAIARWHQGSGRGTAAEAAYRAALSATASSTVHLEALRRYTAYLKRDGRRAEAVEGWTRWHQLAPEDIRPCLELAMYYEWHAGDLPLAQHWAQEALVCLSRWSAGWRRDQAWEQVEHRLARLARKLAGS